MVASLWHQLLGTKVRLLVGLLAGVLRGGSMRACGMGGANHYLFEVQTNSGSRVDLYRLLLPPHGGGGGTSGGGGCLALWAYLRL